MALVVACLDHILPEHFGAPDEVEALTLGLGLLHFPLLALAIWGLAQGGPVLNWAFCFAAAGLYFGQIMNSCTHELIHAGGRMRRGLRRSICVTLLFGHQTTAHPGVHHVHVATPEDLSTAWYGESW